MEIRIYENSRSQITRYVEMTFSNEKMQSQKWDSICWFEIPNLIQIMLHHRLPIPSHYQHPQQRISNQYTFAFIQTITSVAFAGARGRCYKLLYFECINTILNYIFNYLRNCWFLTSKKHSSYTLPPFNWFLYYICSYFTRFNFIAAAERIKQRQGNIQLFSGRNWFLMFARSLWPKRSLHFIEGVGFHVCKPFAFVCIYNRLGNSETYTRYCCWTLCLILSRYDLSHAGFKDNNSCQPLH